MPSTTPEPAEPFSNKFKKFSNEIICKLEEIQRGVDDNRRYLKGDKEIFEDKGMIGDIRDIKRALFGDTRNGNKGLVNNVNELTTYRNKLNKVLLGTWVFIVGIVGKWIYSLIDKAGGN